MWFLIKACTSESFILQLKLFVVAKGLRVTQGRLSRHKMFSLLCSYVVVPVFHFVTPVQIQIAIYDWDIVWKSQLLGSMSLIINAEEQNGASWHLLDTTGKVCIQVMTKRYPISASGSLNGYLGVVARRRLSQDQSKLVGTEVHQKPGPLQTIFNLPLNEVKQLILFLPFVDCFPADFLKLFSFWVLASISL
jgi:hypothetical protein